MQKNVFKNNFTKSNPTYVGTKYSALYRKGFSVHNVQHCHILQWPLTQLSSLVWQYRGGLCVVSLMRLPHSPDASPFPGFKLTCFVYKICSPERIKLTSIKPGYVQPSSIMFTYNAPPLDFYGLCRVKCKVNSI